MDKTKNMQNEDTQVNESNDDLILDVNKSDDFLCCIMTGGVNKPT